MSRTVFAVGVVALTLWTGATMAATAADVRCQSRKNVAAGTYALCRQNATANYVRTGNADGFNAAISRCEQRFVNRWQKIIHAATAAGATCPDSPLTGAQFEGVIDQESANITAALDSDGLHDWATELPQCKNDLAACLASTLPAARLLKTGQTGCYGSDGAGIPCAGTGQDGELQNGRVRSYTDNGDGTITDNQTGLMWESKDQAGGIHYWGANYTWDDAFSVFIAALNNRCADGITDCTDGGDTACTGIGNGKRGFAGHRDWRLPNVNELQSLVDYDVFYPSIAPVFNTNCGPNPDWNPGCTVDGAGGTQKCSCTNSAPYGFAYC
jgi:hypothetical protein